MHDTLAAVPHYGIGYGLLRYLHAPTARLLAATAPADIHFSYAGAIPELAALIEAASFPQAYRPTIGSPAAFRTWLSALVRSPSEVPSGVGTSAIA